MSVRAQRARPRKPRRTASAEPGTTATLWVAAPVTELMLEVTRAELLAELSGVEETQGPPLQ